MLAAIKIKQHKLKIRRTKLVNKQSGLHFELVILRNYVENIIVPIFVID